MPIIQSAIKRNKQAQVRRARNTRVKQAVKADIRVVTDALEAKDAAKVAEAYRAAVSEIDRAVKKGTLHANTAARKKARLNAKVKAVMGADTKPTKVAKKATAAKPAAKKPAAKKTSK